MTRARATRSALARGLPLVLAYLGAGALVTWPLVLHLGSRLGAPQAVGDPSLNLWILGWGAHAWLTDPLGVLSGRVFDGNIFFPSHGTLTYSDHQLLQALVMTPIYGLTGNATLGYNSVLWLSIAASGLAMHALARALTGSSRSAWVAGLAWACWPYRTAHLLHIQLQALYFLPLALLALHRLVAHRRRRDAVWLGGMAGLQAIASVYYGVMTALVLAVVAIVLAVMTRQWRSRPLIGRLLLAAGIGGLLVLPVTIPYIRTQQREGFARNLYEAANHAATARSYVQVPRSNLLYGQTGVLTPRMPRPGERDHQGVEDQLFPGLLLVALALGGIRYGWRHDARTVVASSIVLVVGGVTLSFGPDGARWLYATLHDTVLGFDAVRAPARFAVIAMLGLCPLAALGARAILERSPSRARGAWVTAALIGGLLLEYVNTPLALAGAPPQTTAVGQWLRRDPTPGAVVHVPLTIDIDNTTAMVQSLEHWRPIVNGYSGQRPPSYPAIVDAMSGFPSLDAFAALKELDVRFVVTPAPVTVPPTLSSPLVERVRLDTGVIYEVRWTAENEAALATIESPAPPPPGPIPFIEGETATYGVFWDSGPVALQAGTATLRVVAAAEAARNDATPGAWTFEATARSADWVSRFFTADDRFVTRADEQLMPLVHTREIREGRRRLNRTYLFDRDARVVKMAESAEAARGRDALSLPWNPSARDAVSALYYVRTVALELGDVVAVPINDGGRPILLQLEAAAYETIDVAGVPTPALRLEPRLTARVERRAPLRARIWLSRDDRRVPVKLELDASFGHIRAVLVDYARKSTPAR